MQPKSYNFEVQVENPEKSEILNHEKNMTTLECIIARNNICWVAGLSLSVVDIFLFILAISIKSL